VTELAKTRLRWSLITLCAAGVVAVLIALALFLGGFNAAADAGWSQPATWAIHRTMVHSVEARAHDIAPPDRFTAAEVREGFRVYDTHCAMCHGGPGLGRQPWTAGMEPSPPYLIDAALRWKPEELYWIVRHGVKMTGMPAWNSRISSSDTWSLVGFLEALPRITAADYARLRATTPTSGRPTTEAQPEPTPVAAPQR
jgi:mono/diheme cytochrome c family protein